MIFNMSNIPSDARDTTFHVPDSLTTSSFVISNVETPTGSIRGFVLVRLGTAGAVNESIYFAFAFPNVDSSGNFRYFQYAYASNVGFYVTIYDTSQLTGQGYVYDPVAETLTLNVYSGSIFPAGDYELYVW